MYLKPGLALPTTDGIEFQAATLALLLSPGFLSQI